MRLMQVVRGAVVAVAAVGMMVGGASAASANDMSWSLTNSAGTELGTGFADDAANRIFARDTIVNDRNVRLDVWRVGNKDGTHVRCRDNVAEDGARVGCDLIWVEDTHLAGELCEMDGSTPTRCTAVKDFFN
jgi:hypothetical protein